MEFIAIGISGVLVMALLVYIADVAWLLFARACFTRGEARAVIFAGSTSRFDRWLFNVFFPREQDMSDQ